MTSLAANPYLAETIDPANTTPEELSPWAPRPIPVDQYRVKAMTRHHLEDLCRRAYREIELEATKYEGSRLTEDLAAQISGDVIEAMETLRLALITLAEHRKEPAEQLRGMDLSAVKQYFKKQIGDVKP